MGGLERGMFAFFMHAPVQFFFWHLHAGHPRVQSDARTGGGQKRPGAGLRPAHLFAPDYFEDSKKMIVENMPDGRYI